MNIDKYIESFTRLVSHYLDGDITIYDNYIIFKSRKYKWVCKFPKYNVVSAHNNGISVEQLCDIYIDYIIKEWSDVLIKKWRLVKLASIF